MIDLNAASATTADFFHSNCNRSFADGGWHLSWQVQLSVIPQTYLFIIFTFPALSMFSQSRSSMMACTSIGRSTSTPLLMLSSAPLRLLILLLLLVHITVTSSLVRLTFVTHVNVVSLISVMSQFFGEASTLMFTVSGMHTVVFGLGHIFCSIISSGCLGSVTSLLRKEKRIQSQTPRKVYKLESMLCRHAAQNKNALIKNFNWTKTNCPKHIFLIDCHQPIGKYDNNQWQWSMCVCCVTSILCRHIHELLVRSIPATC